VFSRFVAGLHRDRRSDDCFCSASSGLRLQPLCRMKRRAGEVPCDPRARAGPSWNRLHKEPHLNSRYPEHQ
jgi:hypothetical protein